MLSSFSLFVWVGADATKSALKLTLNRDLRVCNYSCFLMISVLSSAIVWTFCFLRTSARFFTPELMFKLFAHRSDKIHLVTQPSKSLKNIHTEKRMIWKICLSLQAGSSITRLHRPMRSPKHDMEMSILGLHFVVSSQHFSINGRLKVIFLFL